MNALECHVMRTLPVFRIHTENVIAPAGIVGVKPGDIK